MPLLRREQRTEADEPSPIEPALLAHGDRPTECPQLRSEIKNCLRLSFPEALRCGSLRVLTKRPLDVSQEAKEPCQARNNIGRTILFPLFQVFGLFEEDFAELLFRLTHREPDKSNDSPNAAGPGHRLCWECAGQWWLYVRRAVGLERRV